MANIAGRDKGKEGVGIQGTTRNLEMIVTSKRLTDTTFQMFFTFEW